MNAVRVGSFQIGAGEPLALLAGPCVIESEEITMRAAEELAQIGRKRNIGVIFKSSFLKDNRSAEGRKR